MFWIPSSPAISRAVNVRYGLQDGSGQRNSTRLALGDGEYIGMRTAAERLRLREGQLDRRLEARHQPVIRVGGRRGEGREGRPCFRMPPMQCRPISLMPA